jgi:hypothetical protein
MSLCRWKLPWTVRFPGMPAIPPPIPFPTIPIFEIEIPGVGIVIVMPKLPGMPSLPPPIPFPTLPFFRLEIFGIVIMFKPKLPGMPAIPPPIPVPTIPYPKLPPCPLDALN